MIPGDPNPPDQEYRVTKNKPFTLPEKLEGEYKFVLQSVSLVPDNLPENFCFACLPKKPFVVSFDHKQPGTHIVMWASRDNAEDARVKVRGEINLDTGIIKITGSGFEFVVIHAYRVKDK